MAGPPQMTTLARKNPQHTQPEEQVREVAPAPKACLLYTSPSPRDGLLSRMPSSA